MGGQSSRRMQFIALLSRMPKKLHLKGLSPGGRSRESGAEFLRAAKCGALCKIHLILQK